MSEIAWIDDATREYKGVRFTFRDAESLPSQLAEIDAQLDRKRGTFRYTLDDHHDSKASEADRKARQQRRTPEADFQRQVIDLAHLHGWLVAHFRPANTANGWRTAVEADGAGFPDLVLARGGSVLFWELKADRGGEPSPAQRAWLAVLPSARVMRPNDWQEIEGLLK